MILVSRVSFNKYLSPSGLPRPYFVQLRPYTREELTAIVASKLRSADRDPIEPEFYRGYANLILSEWYSMALVARVQNLRIREFTPHLLARLLRVDQQQPPAAAVAGLPPLPALPPPGRPRGGGGRRRPRALPAHRAPAQGVARDRGGTLQGEREPEGDHGGAPGRGVARGGGVTGGRRRTGSRQVSQWTYFGREHDAFVLDTCAFFSTEMLLIWWTWQAN